MNMLNNIIRLMMVSLFSLFAIVRIYEQKNFFHVSALDFIFFVCDSLFFPSLQHFAHFWPDMGLYLQLRFFANKCAQ